MGTAYSRRQQLRVRLLRHGALDAACFVLLLA